MKAFMVIVGLIVGLLTWASTQMPYSVFGICGGAILVSVIIMLICIGNAQEFPYNGRM